MRRTNPAHAAYGLPAAPEPERRYGPLTLLLPILLVAALAVATIWFVALPVLEKPAPPARSCEVVVLETGATKCVKDPAALASRKASGRK